MGQWGGWKYGDLSTYMLAGIWGGLSLQLLHTKRCRELKRPDRGFVGWGGTGEELSVALL